MSLCKNAACAVDESSMAGVRTVVCPSRRSTATPCGARVPTITASTARMFSTACARGQPPQGGRLRRRGTHCPCT
ncbi:hypothetical protein NIA69_09985 [Gemmiger formicilis]|nr:hypothetical protein [Gemmiger formicilis]